MDEAYDWRPRTPITFTPPSAALLSVESRTETELTLALYGWPRISTAGKLLWPS
jgi:hypothetical protein